MFQIRIRICGSGPFCLDPDPDPFLDPDPRIQVILCFHWIPGKIWGHLDFWILKIRQGVQKLGIICHGVKMFGQKIVIFGRFDDVTLIFEDGLSKKNGFLDKKVPNFDGF